MALTKTWREVAIERATKQPEMVDYLLNSNPILANMPMKSTSNGVNHVYEELLAVTEAQIVDMDEALPIVDADSQLKQVNISGLGGKIIVGEDKAKLLGGPGKYFNSKLPKVIQKTGNSLEQSVIYNNLRAGAIAAFNNSALADNTDHALDAGGTSGSLNSIICVKWDMDDTTGLFNPEGFGNGLLFNMLPLSGGNVYTHSDGREIYGMRMKSHFGVLTANPRNLGTIVNIDSNNVPTEDEIDTILEAVRATSNDSILYMAPKVLRLLRQYKDSALRMGVADKNFDRQIDEWNGIPILTSYNFLKDAEAKVTL